MSNKLRDVIENIEHYDLATRTGQHMHKKMQKVQFDQNALYGDTNLRDKIHSYPDLRRFFDSRSKTEVPLAGYINGHFISRRIDRLLIEEDKKTISILDYKTDTNKFTFHDDYVLQMNEYKALLLDIYPDYDIKAFILWLNDFSLEKIL